MSITPRQINITNSESLQINLKAIKEHLEKSIGLSLTTTEILNASAARWGREIEKEKNND